MYITALFLTTIIALFIVADTTRSVGAMQSAQLFEQTVRTFHVAEGAVADAMTEFMDGGSDATVNFSLAEGWQTAGGGTCNSSEPCLLATTIGTTAATVSVDDITLTEPTITAAGTAGMVTRTLEVVIERPNTSPFLLPIFAKESITIGGEVTLDSYDSNLGDYGDLLDPADSDYGNLNQSQAGLASSLGGDMHTDSVDLDTVILGDGANVFGGVMVGAGGVPATVIDGDNATIHGSQTAASSNFNPPAVELPPGSPTGSSLNIGAQQTVTVDVSTCNCSSINVGSEATLILTGTGTLHLSSIDVSTEATFQIDGADVTLVVDDLTTGDESAAFVSTAGRLKIYGTGNGSFNFGNESLMNPTQNPLAMMFYLKGANPLFIGSEFGFYGAIYAPDVDITVEDEAIIHGSLVGNSVTLGGGVEMHYDEALKDLSVTIEQGPTLIRSWREIQ